VGYLFLFAVVDFCPAVASEVSSRRQGQEGAVLGVSSGEDLIESVEQHPTATGKKTKPTVLRQTQFALGVAVP
jgi:hypothetical protein